MNPGDEITATIRYKADVGTVVAGVEDDAIGGAVSLEHHCGFPAFSQRSRVVHFPERFFNKAATASKTSYVLSTPVVDVETEYLDEQTMC